MNNIILAKNALNYLKSGYTLYSLIDNNKFLFRYIDSKLYIHSNNSYQKISEYLFKKIYNNCHFFIEDEQIEEIDTLKDKEYYSWTQ